MGAYTIGGGEELASNEEGKEKVETLEMKLDDYLATLNIKFRATEIENESKEWDSATFRAYRVTITRAGERAGFSYYQGKGIKHEPTLADVICALAVDRSYSNYTLKEFGDEFGWNEYTAKTLRGCKKNAEKIERLFQGEELEKVQELASQY